MARNQHTFDEDNRAGAGKKNPRVTRAEAMPYRARFIAGEDLEDKTDRDGVVVRRGLARDFMDEFAWDTYEHALIGLRNRAHGESWHFLRERHQEYVAQRIVEEAGDSAVDRFNTLVKAGANFMVEAGIEALTRISPISVTEAVLMFREGREAGYRALGEPDRLTRADVNLGGTLSVEHSHAHNMQGLGVDEYKTAALAKLAELAATLGGTPAPQGRDEPPGDGQ